MRVLVVDPDAQFATLVADRLLDDGHDVTCAGNPQQMDALLRARSADVVVIDLSRRRMNGFDVARELRASHGGDLGLVLVSPSHEENDAEVMALVQEVDARAFYTRPCDLDLLANDLLQPHVPRLAQPVAEAPPKASTDAPPRLPRPEKGAQPVKARKRNVDWSNARLLMGLWAGRASGRLKIGPLGEDGEVLIRDGGLIDPTSVPLVELLLDGAEVTWSEEPVDGLADWALLGNQVFSRCRVACSESAILGYMTATPVATDHTQVARALAITGPSRKLMGAIDGQSTLKTLLEQCQVVPSEVSSDLEVLVQLALLTLRRGEVTEAVREKGAPEVEVSAEDALALKGARESRDLEGLPAIDQQAVAGAHSQESVEAIEARLERELETIQQAPPPIVLGVPADASTALVDEAASRMRNRYAHLAQDSNQSEAVRSLADRIGRIVRDAHRHFNFHEHTATGSTNVKERVVDDLDRVEVLLDQGRKLIARSEWSAADAILTEAHRVQLDHPGVLSNLGWARLHNPDRRQEDRTEEGRDFLLLGEQFDPGNADGQYFLAQFLLASNMIEAASKRAQRARDAAPGEPARAALYRKIQIKLAEMEG